VADFERLHSRVHDGTAFLYAFDLLELDGVDHRPQPLEARKAALVKLLRKARSGIHLVEHIPGDGATIFKHACLSIVSKRRDHPYRSGSSKAWLKIKNPTAPGVLRFEDRS
jgi:bifunctional non-homologous end joining protein LigD